MSLTIIIATTGRPSLVRTLNSMKNQDWHDGDEILLVADGIGTNAKHYLDESGLPGRFVEIEGPHNDWGHEARNVGLPMVRTTHTMHMDDDDIYLDGAFATVRDKVAKNPDSCHIFRMWMVYYKILIWRHKAITIGDVSTQMFVHPANVFGKWPTQYQGDYYFIRDTCEMRPYEWHEEVISHIMLERTPCRG